MTDSKIEFKVGSLKFSAQGDAEWLANQLDKVLAAAPGLHSAGENQNTESGETSNPAGASNPSVDTEFKETLASYIKAKGGDTNQVNRFLATADWLRRRGNSNLTTSAVSKALSDHHQKKLGNPADCLNKNVSKGHCEKKGDGFFITPDGMAVLGHS